MWKSNIILLTRSRWTQLIGQVLVLLSCVVYVIHAYTSNILPDKYAEHRFKKTSCVLINKELISKGHLFVRYRANFLITYNVSGVQYNRWVSGNGLDDTYTDNDSEQEDILAQYSVGNAYPCWFNPENPEMAILVLRHSWLSTFPLIIPSVIVVITFYFLIKTLKALRKSRTI